MSSARFGCKDSKRTWSSANVCDSFGPSIPFRMVARAFYWIVPINKFSKSTTSRYCRDHGIKWEWAFQAEMGWFEHGCSAHSFSELRAAFSVNPKVTARYGSIFDRNMKIFNVPQFLRVASLHFVNLYYFFAKKTFQNFEFFPVGWRAPRNLAL